MWNVQDVIVQKLKTEFWKACVGFLHILEAF